MGEFVLADRQNAGHCSPKSCARFGAIGGVPLRDFVTPFRVSIAGLFQCIFSTPTNRSDQSKFVLTALCIEDASWRAAFNAAKEFRRRIKADHGIRISAELHAHSFVRKVDDGISDRVLSQARRRDLRGGA